ncbi:CAP domain-containing protein [Kitasatospora sp. NPDC056138]|uniref:CAP domain-containing protein n=1 Tax=Kitasatospora sp. NPDC056138 TaxID=3345724 RepID=UPI0035E3138A
MHATNYRIRGACAAACAASLLLLAGATGASAAPSGTNLAPQTSGGEILALENAARAQQGCPALNENGQLTQAAQVHSTDMANNNFFSHTGSDGSDIATRAARAGFSPSIPTSENISSGATSSQAVFDGWMGSAPHRAAILNCSWTQTGIAGSGTLWTQVLGT